MKHAGRARRAAVKLILWTLVAAGALLAAALSVKPAVVPTAALALPLGGVWLVFALFTLYFFRDPDARTPREPNLVVSPAHGKVDVIDELVEGTFMGGRCRRISIFLSVIDIHTQNAPVGGRLALVRHTPGKFLNALKTESAEQNENLLLGFESSERPGENIGVRLIAGLLARRIVPFAKLGDKLDRGDRISLIQFGSRTDLYLPMDAKVQVSLGQRVVGGETVMAALGNAR
jgi:phosphatidylserine decarboxylase